MMPKLFAWWTARARLAIGGTSVGRTIVAGRAAGRLASRRHGSRHPARRRNLRPIPGSGRGVPRARSRSPRARRNPLAQRRETLARALATRQSVLEVRSPSRSASSAATGRKLSPNRQALPKLRLALFGRGRIGSPPLHEPRRCLHQEEQREHRQQRDRPIVLERHAEHVADEPGDHQSKEHQQQ